MRWLRVAGVRLAFTICASAGTANAQADLSDKTAFAIAYEAPAGCPTAAAFEEQVSSRVGADRIVPRADDARTLKVSLRPHGNRFLGTLSVGQSRRTLRADTCPETAKALALATAIVIDPEAALSSEAVTEPDETEQPAPISPEKPAGTKPAVEPPSKPALSVAAAPAPVARDRISSPERPEFWISAGPLLEVRSAVASEVVPAAGAFVDGEMSRHSLLSPALRVSGFVAKGSEHAALGSADVRVLAARLDACPIKQPLARSLDLRPCAFFELGERRIDARTTAESESKRRLWAAPGIALRGRWSPVQELGLELQVASSAPLDRTTITFAESNTGQQQELSAPAVGIAVGAAVATRFSP
jgi:hypothetical protein